MLFPIGDTNVAGGYRPIISYTLILLNIVVFFLQLSDSGHLICSYATIPSDILSGVNFHTLLTSMFMHGGWMHLIGNLLFLWVFADNIEAVIGNIRFLGFFLMGGIFASLLHILIETQIGSIVLTECCKPCLTTTGCGLVEMCTGFTPSLGASGAISATLGAYIILFPSSRIKVLFFFWTFSIPALYFLGIWFVEQLIAGVGALGPLSPTNGGVAWWAHIGGFVFGLAYGLVHKKSVSELIIRAPRQ